MGAGEIKRSFCYSFKISKTQKMRMKKRKMPKRAKEKSIYSYYKNERVTTKTLSESGRSKQAKVRIYQ